MLFDSVGFGGLNHEREHGQRSHGYVPVEAPQLLLKEIWF